MDEDTGITWVGAILLALMLAGLLGVAMWRALDAMNAPAYIPSTTSTT